MAKVSFNKLGLKVVNEPKEITYNDQIIEIQQYLPIETKLEMISNIVNNSATDQKFYNKGKIEIYTTLEILYNYTNIKFTDKQKEDICKLYDLMVSSGLYDIIITTIPKSELEFIDKVVENTIKNIYKYSNSAYGILDSILNDYDNLNLNASEIYQKLADGENVEFLKEVMAKLG